MPKKQTPLFIIAIIILLLIIADLILWFIATGNTNNFEEAKAQYLSHYPNTLQNARLLTVVSIVLLTFTGYIFLNTSKTQSLKSVASVLGFISALLFIWKIFTLM